MCYAMAIWVSFVSGCRRFACCSAEKNKRKQKYRETEASNGNELEDLEASRNAEACRLLDEEKQRLEEQLKAAKARIFELEAQNVKSRAASTPKETRIRVEKEAKSEAEDCDQVTVGKLELDESNIIAECESLHWVVEKLNDEVATLRTKLNESILKEETSNNEVSRLASELQKSLETSERFNETRSHCNELELSLHEKETKTRELERLIEQLYQTIEQLKYKQSLK